MEVKEAHRLPSRDASCLPRNGGRRLFEFVGELKGIPSGDIKKRVDEVLAIAPAIGQQKPHRQASKGYRQRVGLAQAIIHNPDVLSWMSRPPASIRSRL